VADEVVYSRDRVLRSVLDRFVPGATLRRVPVGLAHLAGVIAERSSHPLSRYVVDQLANPVVLDTSRLKASGVPADLLGGNLADFLQANADLRCVSLS
jgi:hypothetical protein